MEMTVSSPNVSAFSLKTGCYELKAMVILVSVTFTGQNASICSLAMQTHIFFAPQHLERKTKAERTRSYEPAGFEILQLGGAPTSNLCLVG